ncbi:hypothetical protein F2Q69_00016470 [Brassica cretica]|uniref:Uncharacterized protein n=1 Tax=Brassica cretica TaxID=69181 RepID=A0A8S9R4Q2_BRACR|nr:hypothetical protein F2Q69_00016470 [Brassica cretica]
MVHVVAGIQQCARLDLLARFPGGFFAACRRPKDYIKRSSKEKEEDIENGEEGFSNDTNGEPMPERQGEKGDGFIKLERKAL